MKKQTLTVKILVFSVIIALLAVLAASCSTEKADSSYDNGYYTGDYESGKPSIGGSGSSSNSSGNSGGIGTIPTDGISNPNAKVIKKANASISTLKYDELIEKLYAKITELEGYTDQDSFGGSAPYRYANVTARIPAEKLDDFKTALSELGTLTQYTATKVDVTLTYSKLKAKIDTLKLQAEAVQNLFDLAEAEGDLAQIRTLQSELFALKREIAEAEAELAVYDNSIAYSTVTITINETKEYVPPVEEEEKGLFSRIFDELKESFEAVVWALGEIVVWFFGSIPYFIFYAFFIALAIFVAILIYRLWKKFKNKRSTSEELTDKEFVESLDKKDSLDAKSDATNTDDNSSESQDTGSDNK